MSGGSRARMAALAIGGALACGAALAGSMSLVNPGFESRNPGLHGNPEGWTTVQHAGPLSYTFKLDTETRRGGERSLRIDNVGPEPFGQIFQQLSAAALRGKTVRLSAWLKTKDATGGGAGLTLQAMQGGATIAHNHMTGNTLKGTADWTRHEITLAIPKEADRVEVGAMLQGPGTLWLDDVELDVIASP